MRALFWKVLFACMTACLWCVLSAVTGCDTPESSSGTTDIAEDSCGTDGMTYLVYGCRRGSEAQAEAYNKANGNPSFEEWKAERCFDGEEDVLQYFNAADLALGRELHATRCGTTIAAYVSNFGVPGQTADDGVHAIDAGQSKVAVAMDYQPTRPAGEEVQFFVFFDGQPATGLAFDREGQKHSPFACTICHGGRYDDSTHQVKDAFFLPLLSESLELRSLKVKDEEIRRRMNALVYDATAPRERRAQGILDVLDAAYPDGVHSLAAEYKPRAVLGAWDSNDADRQLYSTLIRPHCSMCHAAQLTSPFDTPGQYDERRAVARQLVCDLELMPQSLEGRKRLNDDHAAMNLACEEVGP